MARSPSQLKGVTAVARPPLLANSVAHRFDSVLVGAHSNFSALELRYPFLTFSAAGSGYLLPSQAVCLFLSLLPLTWIDYSMNSAIILAQSCIRDPRPLRWFQLQYFLEVGNGNMASALFNPLQQLLAIGSSDRQTGGPVSQPPHPVLHVSRFSVIPKRHHPGKWRLILDLLSPACHSVNDGIADEHFISTLHGCRWDYCGHAAGAGFSYGEIGCANAYHIVPANTKDWQLSCIKWGSAFDVDMVLPFRGLVSSIYLHM